MTKTIRERASDAAWENNKSFPDAQIGTFQDGYIKGSTDQRKIDIEKACKWLLANRLNYDYLNLRGDVYDASLVKDFKKAMEDEQ